jgi:hypothetical protein
MFAVNRILARGDTQTVGVTFFLPRGTLIPVGMTAPVGGSSPGDGFEGYSNHGFRLACGPKALQQLGFGQSDHTRHRRHPRRPLA